MKQTVSHPQIKRVFLFLRKQLRTLTLCVTVLSLAQTAFSQTPYCNMIQHHHFDNAIMYTPPPPSMLDHFKDGKVQPWWDLGNSPHIAGGGSSTPYAAMMYDHVSSSGEGVFQRIGSLIPGKKYVLVIRQRRDAGNTAPGAYTVGFLFEAGVTKVRAGWPVSSVTSQVPLSKSPATNWQTDSVCFTASDTFSSIFIKPVGTGSSVLWMKFDDVELYELKPYAGRDTTICGPRVSMTFGKAACPPYPSNVKQSFKWYENTVGSTVIGTASTLTRTPPFGRTKYIIERTLAGCVDYDTVEVCISLQPSVDLGPDTTMCGPACYTMSAPYDAQFRYRWSTGDTTYSITKCKSGTYWVEVTTECGCTGTDTVKVTILPEIYIDPEDTTLCSNSLPYTLNVTPGYTSYLWSTGSTTTSTTINSGGTYWVTVTDSNGCESVDSVTITVNTGVTVNLGPDVTKCEPETVELCAPTGNYSYLWNTGATTRCITVSTTGTYYVTVTTPDGCVGSDTVNVTINPKPVVTAGNLGSYCISDPDFALTHGTPSGGNYSGPGVASNRFYPRGAGVGTHTLQYTYTDPTTGCKNTASFTVTVKNMPHVQIDPRDPLCLNDAAVYLHSSPVGGTWTGTTSDSLFDPMAEGVGTHTVTYCYYDTASSCNDCDTFYMVVKDTIDAYIAILTQNPCKGMEITLEAKATGMSSAGLSFYWLHNGATTSQVKVTQNGTYSVVITDTTGACPDTAEITLNLSSCCNQQSTYVNYTVSTYEHWQDDTIVIENELRILGLGGHLELDNVKLIMKRCSKIIVERGGFLEADSTEFGICDTGWMGIEVWGSIDACPDNFGVQGRVTANACTFKHADIAIFAGTRVTPPGGGGTDRRYWGGGVIQVQHCTFENNYVDLMFSEYQMAGACVFNCTKQCWQHFGYYNQFLPLRSDERCLDMTGQYFATNAISTYGLNRCHIVDFNLKPNVWSIPNFCPPAGLLFCGNCPPPPPGNPGSWTLDQQQMCPSPNWIWDFNTYANPCSNATYR